MRPLALLCTLVPVIATAQVGKLGSVEKSVQIRSESASSFKQARLNQLLFQDQHLRTLKRARALIKFDLRASAHYLNWPWLGFGSFQQFSTTRGTLRRRDSKRRLRDMSSTTSRSYV